MPLDRTKLYTTNDGPIPRHVYTVSADTITAAGYFNAAWKELQPGSRLEHRLTAGGVRSYTIATSTITGVTLLPAT
jgi:hypothetical protein